MKATYIDHMGSGLTIVNAARVSFAKQNVDSEPEFYTPGIWRKRAANKKQGSSQEAAPDQRHQEWRYRQVWVTAQYNYEKMIADGVAPEQARMVLPQSMYTEWYWTGSLAAWARFVKQRTHDGAQEETPELARQCAAIIEPLFPVSWAALVSDAA